MRAKQALKECHALRGLTDDQLEKVAALCSEEIYEPGATIFQAGSNAERLLVLVEGKVALQMALPTQQSQLRKRVTVDVISKGELFGWSSIVEPNVYTLSAICLQRATVLAIDASKLVSLLQQDCPIGYEVLHGIMGVVAARLRDTMQLLVTERSLA